MNISFLNLIYFILFTLFSAFIFQRFYPKQNKLHKCNHIKVKKYKATAGLFIHTGRTGLKSYQNLTTTIQIISGNKLLKLLNVKKVEETNWHKEEEAA